MRGERAEALAGGAGEAKCDRVVGKTFLAEAPRHFTGQHGTHGAIHVPNRQLGADALFPVEREMRELEQRVVQSDGQPVILRAHHAPRSMIDGRRKHRLGHVQELGEVERGRLGVHWPSRLAQHVCASDQVIHCGDPELRHQLTHLFGDEEEIVHDVLGFARELCAQRGILRRDAHRTRIEMAFAHHHAAFDDQWRRRKAEFLGAQQRRDHHVASRLELPVCLQTNAPAQTI